MKQNPYCHRKYRNSPAMYNPSVGLPLAIFKSPNWIRRKDGLVSDIKPIKKDLA